MPEAAQGSGQRHGASWRDECAPRAPEIRVTAPQSGHSRAFHMALDDGGRVAVCRTQKLAEPSTSAWGMSFVMQSTILEAVTTRLANQKAPGDKGHCGCADQHKALVEGWICRSTQHISDWLLDVMDGKMQWPLWYRGHLGHERRARGGLTRVPAPRCTHIIRRRINKNMSNCIKLLTKVEKLTDYIE
jgi:hypothetical protein